MKKQIINKVLAALLISTVATPQAYGDTSLLKAVGITAASAAAATTIALPAISISGLMGGGAAVIGKAIVDRLFNLNNQQNTANEKDDQTKQDNVSNILLSGFIGGGISELSLPKAFIGAGLAYLCNNLYDLTPCSTTRNYNSYRTAFMSGAIGATLIQTLVFAGMGAVTGLIFSATQNI